ncbi:helix-turn-helix domain-containing protein [Paenibacillus paridis]|uniref:helix-turn-helix domain-containing protein n=1 Tax=Paenibacillus paridis TaxID=2583376 RepID=UPI0011243C5A|nr:helix-turn-helix transcriptional regulator [Paenibacillus paridis]
MLKERIDFLCKKRELTRKELVEGLVTQAHFANILAERYPLVDDLAEQIAERLRVSVSYILHAAAKDENSLDRANHIFNELAKSVSSETEQFVDALVDKDDSLVVELTTALMKAVYYQQINDGDAHRYLHHSYLNFYLEKIGRPDEADVPAPLKKALLFYKIQYFRSQNHYYDALSHIHRLIGLVETGTEAWLTVQNMQMEACIYLKQFEQAKATFDQTMKTVYEERLFHRLPALYVSYSGYCFAMGLYQEALLALSMAEANLVYADSPGDIMTTIMNNRIVMLTMTGELDKAAEEIARFEELAQQEPDDIRQKLMLITLIYRCEVAYTLKNWAMLADHLAGFANADITADQQMAILFYRSQLALSQEDKSEFMELALACVPYFESIQHVPRLEQLYECLAVVSESGRRYKESTVYYQKLVYVLRNR